MATLLAVANQKGGCGKTTTVMNVAGGLDKAGYRVLVIDTDLQNSATAWSIAKGPDSLPFDVQPGRLVKSLNPLIASTEYDIVLFDCPAGIADAQATLSPAQKLARAAVCAADAVLVPLRPSVLDFTAAASFVYFLAEQRREVTGKVLVLLNGMQNTVLSRQARMQAAALFAPVHASVLNATVGHRASIAEVAGSGQTIFDYRPDHIAAQEYTTLTKEIIQCLSSNAHPSASFPMNSTTPTSHLHNAA